MSYPFNPRPHVAGPHAPAAPGPTRRRSVLAAAGLFAAGLLLMPGQARADGYGHAEITLGFPHGAVTVGRTWEDHPRQVVVEEVTHKYPEADDEASFDESEMDENAIYDEDSADPDLVIEKRIVRPRTRHVTVIERYEEPVHVVRRVYVERPSCERQVVVYGRPAVHVYHASSPTVILAPGRPVYHGGGWRGSDHGGGYRSDRGGHSESHNVGNQGPRNLFPEDHGRPMRERGVGHSMVQIGAHR